MLHSHGATAAHVVPYGHVSGPGLVKHMSAQAEAFEAAAAAGASPSVNLKIKVSLSGGSVKAVPPLLAPAPVPALPAPGPSEGSRAGAGAGAAGSAGPPLPDVEAFRAVKLSSAVKRVVQDVLQQLLADAAYFVFREPQVGTSQACLQLVLDNMAAKKYRTLGDVVDAVDEVCIGVLCNFTPSDAPDVQNWDLAVAVMDRVHRALLDKRLTAPGMVVTPSYECFPQVRTVSWLRVCHLVAAVPLPVPLPYACVCICVCVCVCVCACACACAGAGACACA
jgi:hypothetical protein